LGDSSIIGVPPGDLTIGEGADNGIVITGSSLSPVHAVLKRDGYHVWLTDQSTQGGTFINDKRIEPSTRASQLRTTQGIDWGLVSVLPGRELWSRLARL
jgi:pSer/pThr/pTyr-binding forkhead associated (FHA) protein